MGGVNGFFSPTEGSLCTLAIMPGDDLLFQRLSVSTIGADRFHGRVRDGIGWVTVAMVTKQYGQRAAASLGRGVVVPCLAGVSPDGLLCGVF